MKLPLSVHYDYYGQVRVVDAGHRVVVSLRESGEARRFARHVVRKSNNDFRWRFFGIQYLEYTREDWIDERNESAKA